MSTDYLRNYTRDGFCIVRGNKKNINFLRDRILKIIKNELNLKNRASNPIILKNFHKINIQNLNEIRLKIFNKMNNHEFKKNYFFASKKYLENIVGNEISMQKKINLSIQLPEDESSILPVHSDTWAGDSPFEVVVWVPLMNVFRSASMFILPKKIYKKNKFEKFNFKNNEEIYSKFKNDLKFLKLNFGEILIFNQNLPHGNIVNKENFTRWSFNCRFKSLFSPYKDKKFIEFFEPLNLKPATIDGISYKKPNFN